MTADISLGLGVEPGEGVDALVHGEGRARHGRLEPAGRIAGVGDGAEVEVAALEKLAGGFRQDEGDRPFGLAQALVVGLPVFRQPVSAALDGELAAEVGEDEEDGLQQHDERHQPGERAGRIVVLDMIRVGHRESMWAPGRGRGQVFRYPSFRAHIRR